MDHHVANSGRLDSTAEPPCRFKALAQRSSVSCLILWEPGCPEWPLIFDLVDGRVPPDVVFFPALRAGFKIAGVIGLCDGKIRSEIEPGAESVMQRAREAFIKDLVFGDLPVSVAGKGGKQ